MNLLHCSLPLILENRRLKIKVGKKQEINAKLLHLQNTLDQSEKGGPSITFSRSEDLEKHQDYSADRYVSTRLLVERFLSKNVEEIDHLHQRLLSENALALPTIAVLFMEA